ncbi:hypothetical protein GH714_004699 [Hevea brasiliensis]|uniref:Uncharacterized protein n=1 Tax=Hevea brasiliensis TaxID=3981 RepID=A0A6A6MWM2_HEVBR|nr:hypothetical protein GH714_004699 [Hevea brasiliensis]
MALDTILAIVPMMVEYTFVPVKRHLSYAFNCGSKIEKLKNQVGNLKNQRDGLKPHVNGATRRGDEIYANVQNWLTSVDEAIGEADDLVVDEEQARERCFLGLIPNLKKRYKLSKKVEKKAQTVAELREKGEFDLDRISYRPPLWQIVPPSVYNNEVLHSRIFILEKVMNALRDPAFNMIGVYGVGGVGKTTLAKEVRRKAIEDKLFDVVLMGTVSETPELRKIQGTIADMLCLELKEETEEGRACRLRQRLLQEKKILVILDDIWEQLERREDILSRDMGTQESFELRVLSEAEAWSLFVTVVGDVTNQDLRSIATEVAKKCAGLPVLIVTVAGALKNRDLNEWNVALKELSKVDNEGIQSKVYATLKLSYNHLASEELKSFFLLCAQIAQSDIQIGDLLLYSMGLDLLRSKDTVEYARNRVYKLERDHKASCLLLEGDRNGSLKMHDVVRDTALDIASKSQHPFTFRDVVETKEWPNRDFRSCSRIALPSCEIHELPERMCLWSLPPSLGYLTNLLTLCLDECVLRDASVIGELKRLEVLSFRRSMIEELPREIAHLTRLKLLDLSDCDKLKVIPANVISRLSLLEELYMLKSFGQWELQGLNSSNNASLAELKNLSRLTTLEIDVPDVKMLPKDLFSNKLERYDIVIGKKRYRYDEYLSSRRLRIRLNTDIHLDHGVDLLLKKAEVLYLDNVKGIKSILYDMDWEGFPQLKHLDIKNSDDIQYVINSTVQVPSLNVFPILEPLSLNNLVSLEKICYGRLTTGPFTKLRILKVGTCNRLKSLFSFSMVRNLSQLQEMTVEYCQNMEEIVIDQSGVGEDNIEVAEFSQLRSLRLGALPALKSFCLKVKESTSDDGGSNEIVLEDDVHNPRPLFEKMGQHGEEQHHITIQQPLHFEKKVFPNLEELSLDGQMFEMILQCQLPKGFLSKVNSVELIREKSNVDLFGFLQRLPNLETVFVDDSFLQEFVLQCEDNDGAMLPRIRNLNLWRLNYIKHIWKPHPQMDLVLQNLQTMNVFHCYNLVSLAPSSASFQNLTALVVYSCKVLKHLVTPSTAKSMVQLVTMEIRACEMLTEIVVDEQNGTPEEIEFGKLKTLRLIDLESLTSFCFSGFTFKFPCLEVVTVERCPNMRTFSAGVLSTPKLQFVQSRENNFEKWLCEGDLNTIIRQFYTEMDGFNGIKKFILSKFPHIKEKWHTQLPLKLLDGLSELVVDNCEYFSKALSSNQLQFLNRLEELHLIDLPKLRCLWNKDPRGILDFKNLRLLKVHNCSSLGNIFTLPMALELVKLECIEIKRCSSLEEIINKEGEEEGARDKTIFPSLHSIILEYLPSLVSFYSRSDVLNCPSLEKIEIIDCPKMETFSNKNSSGVIVEGSKEPCKRCFDAPTVPIFSGKVSS